MVSDIGREAWNDLKDIFWCGEYADCLIINEIFGFNFQFSSLKPTLYYTPFLDYNE